jgi:glycogen debranching enzyme
MAEPPIALCEVQGYAYAAWQAAAEIAAVLGDRIRADMLQGRARQLKERFQEAFWVPELATYALALDGKKRPCQVRSSNPGHCLYTGIASPAHARQIATTLLDDASFSGWGIRTLAAGEARYNPMSYHNGSVWPHDNALIAAGMARYGHTDEALRVLSALFDASLHFDGHRLPELFCGFPRRPSEGPTLYPVACSPQAWASAAVFGMLQAVLGLEFHPGGPEVALRSPRLPEFVQWMKVNRLAVRGHSVDLLLQRYRNNVGIEVTRKEGDIEVKVAI